MRDYEGTWSGDIVQNEALREGLVPESHLMLVIDEIDQSRLQGRLSLHPAQPVTAGVTDATLIPMEAAMNDIFGDLDFDDDPLATYAFHVMPDDPDEASATVLISAHAGDRIQVRLMRYDLYGVFHLSR